MKTFVIIVATIIALFASRHADAATAVQIANAGSGASTVFHAIPHFWPNSQLMSPPQLLNTLGGKSSSGSSGFQLSDYMAYIENTAILFAIGFLTIIITVISFSVYSCCKYPCCCPKCPNCRVKCCCPCCRNWIMRATPDTNATGALPPVVQDSKQVFWYRWLLALTILLVPVTAIVVALQVEESGFNTSVSNLAGDTVTSFGTLNANLFAINSSLNNFTQNQLPINGDIANFTALQAQILMLQTSSFAFATSLVDFNTSLGTASGVDRSPINFVVTDIRTTSAFSTANNTVASVINQLTQVQKQVNQLSSNLGSQIGSLTNTLTSTHTTVSNNVNTFVTPYNSYRNLAVQIIWSLFYGVILSLVIIFGVRLCKARKNPDGLWSNPQTPCSNPCLVFVIMLFSCLLFALLMPMAALTSESCEVMDYADTNLVNVTTIFFSSANFSISSESPPITATVLGNTMQTCFTDDGSNLATQLGMNITQMFGNQINLVPTNQTLNFTFANWTGLLSGMQLTNITSVFGFQDSSIDVSIANLNTVVHQYAPGLTYTRANVSLVNTTTPGANATQHNQTLFWQNSALSLISQEASLTTQLAGLQQNLSVLISTSAVLQTTITSAQTQGNAEISNINPTAITVQMQTFLDSVSCSFIGDVYITIKGDYCNSFVYIMGVTVMLCFMLMVLAITLLVIFICLTPETETDRGVSLNDQIAEQNVQHKIKSKSQSQSAAAATSIEIDLYRADEIMLAMKQPVNL